MRGKLWRKTGLALLLVALCGLLRVPFEDRLQTRLEADQLLPTPLGVGMIDQMGQSAFLATLGGTRALVAIYMSLLAYDHWEQQDWGGVENAFDVIYKLQPNDIQAWILGAWHQHTNASVNMEQRHDWREWKLPHEATREEVRDRYIAKGIGILGDAVRNNPESGKLYQEYAWTLWKKGGDACAAAEAYKHAIEHPGSLGFTVRFYGYTLAECPGREREAYDYLLKLYREVKERGSRPVPSVVVALKKLENTLDVPFLLRIPELEPDEALKRSLEQDSVDSGLPWLP